MSDEKPTVLLVDDEFKIQQAVRRSCRLEEFSLITAFSGEQALEMMEQQEVQVLLSDARMPGMGGVDLLKIARQKYPKVIRMMISGFIETENLINAINQGQVFRFITKPWKKEELRDLIYEGIKTYRSRGDNTDSMEKILMQQPNPGEKSTADMVISKEILEALSRPAFCIDSRFSIAICNSRARELNIRTGMNSLRSVLPEKSIEEIAAALLPGGRRILSPVHINGNRWKMRIRPFRKTDALTALLFLDAEKTA